MRSLRRCRVLPRLRPHPVYVISRGRLRRAVLHEVRPYGVGRLRRAFASGGTAIIGRIPGGRYYGLLSSYVTVALPSPDFHMSGRIGAS